MPKTIAVIESLVQHNPTTKQVCSIYGTIPPGYTETISRGYTWRLVDHRGSITIGLGRKPEKNRKNALLIAKNFSEKFNYTLIERYQNENVF